MADLNFNVLARPGPRGFYQGFEQGQEQRRVQENQLAEQQMKQQANMQAQQLNALKMQGYQEDRALKMQGYQEGRAAKTRAEKAALFRDSILRAPDPNTAREVIKRQYADPDLGPLLQQTIPIDAALSEISDDVEQFKQYQQREALGLEGYAKSQLPKNVGNAMYIPATDSFRVPPREFAPAAPAAPVRQPPMVEEFNFARSPEGGNFAGTFQDYVTAREAAKRPPPIPARVAAGGAGGAGAGAGGAPAPKPMTQVQAAARRDKLGKEFKVAQSALQTTQDVLDSIAFVKSEPGLSRATGFIGTLLPSIPEGQAASAETRLKNLEGKITALGKAQAASTGAIGSIANQEWKILADQIAAIDRTKGTGPLLAQLELVEAQAQGALERIRDGYQRQFGEDFEQFPQFADLPAPKTSFKPRAPAGGKPAAAGGGLSPAEQAELDQLRKQFRK
jgi:hypothetical protein